MFWEVEFGYLMIWLFDDSPDLAAQRASDIVELLPYESSLGIVKVYDGHGSTKEEFIAGEEQAKQIGIGIRLFCCATGVEDTNPDEL